MARVEAVGVHGIGLYLPEQVRRNDWWPEEVVEGWRAHARESLLRPEEDTEVGLGPGARLILAAMREVESDPFRGVVERRVMPEEMVASDMEAAAGREALERAGVAPGEIGVVLSSSQLPDYLVQATAPRVHRLLGLPARCMSLGVESSSNGFLDQLVIADALIKSGATRYALLTQSSGFLHLAPPDEPQSAWFGDGATAVVVGPVSPGRGLLGQAHATHGGLFDALVVGTPGARWYSGRPVILNTPDIQQTREMLVGIADRGKGLLEDALRQAGARLEDVQFYACHQSTVWFRKATQAFFGLAGARSYDSFAWTASLASSNIPFVLGMAERQGTLSEGDLIATHAGGSGITWSSLVLRWGK